MTENTPKKVNLKINREVLLLIAVLLFTTIQIFYSDCRSNSRQGMLVWEALFSGRFFHYYSVSKEALDQDLMIHFANYDMVMNIIVAVWELPLYIIEKAIGCRDILMEYMAARIYSKMLMLIFLLLSAREVSRIGDMLGLKKVDTDKLFFLFPTSIFALTSAVSVAQLDIVGLFFTLKAIYYILKKDNMRFMMFFIIAVQCKMFPLFIITPMVIAKEKRLWKMGVEAGLPMAVNFLVALPFKIIDPAGAAEKKIRTEEMVEVMLRLKLPILGFTVPVLFLTYMAVCLYAYCKKTPDGESEKKWYMLWLSFAGTLAYFFAIADGKPYWCVYFLPFMLLFYMRKGENREKRLLVETAATMSLAVGYTMENYWCFSAIGIMPFGKLLNNDNYIHLEDIFLKFGHESYYMAWTITYAIFAVYILGLFISNRPGSWNLAPVNGTMDIVEAQNDGISEKKAYRWIMLRTLLAVGLSSASLILCILGLLGFTHL
ncbi:MAG: hypothetical protein K6G19_03575 [Lachnospiraceae bacterium]|nr:hypothetical protein [Lachnospiraceae bacterium]